MLAMVVGILASCSDGGSEEPITPTPKPEEVKTEITIDSGIISNGLFFGTTEGEQSVSFSVNADWRLSIASTTSGVTWCKASATSGSKGMVNVKFTVDENTDYEDRSVSVTIKAGSVSKTFTITQKGADALLVTTTKYEVAQEGGQIEIEVKANISYQMEISEDAKNWITEAESKGRALTTTKHKLDIAMNEDAEKREGEITFKSGDKVETVKVYQAGGAILLLSQNECNVSDKGDTIFVDIKSNIDFGVQMPDVDWISDEASSRGMSSHTLKYVIAANETYDSRSAEIVFYDKNSDLKDTLKVVQAQKDAIIVAKNEYTIDAIGGDLKFEVNTNVDFEVSTSVDWIKQNGESRSLEAKPLSFTISENTADESREGLITIGAGNVRQAIKVVQKGLYSEFVSVFVSEAGTLNVLIEESAKFKIINLKVAGSINGTDIKFLREMAGRDYNNLPTEGSLNYLDLQDVNIVEGGSDYYENCKSENNQISSYFLSGCNSLRHVILPLNIVSIGTRAFSDCDELETIVLPQGLIQIDSRAFENCGNLNSIEFPETLKEIGMYCFSECSNLTSVLFPNNIEEIGQGAFSYCSNLKAISLPKNLKVINENMFSVCQRLESIILPENLVKIDEYAFNSCTNLHGINLPQTLKEIGKGAFYGCENLDSITLPGSIDVIKEKLFYCCFNLKSLKILGNIIRIEEEAFVRCESLKEFTIPENIEVINKWTFGNCKSLEEIIIPKHVKQICESAFDGCRNMQKIEVYNPLPPNIESSCFNYVDVKKCKLYIPKGSLSDYKEADYWKEFSNILEME